MTKHKKVSRYDFQVPWYGNVVPFEVSSHDTVYSSFNKETKKWEDFPIDWRDNKPFKAAFKAIEFVAQTSSTRVLMEDVSTGARFHIRELEFFEAMEQLAVLHGLFIGEWYFHKTSGRYYGLKLYY